MRLRGILAALLALTIVGLQAGGAAAHHKDANHVGQLWQPWEQWEMNNRTTSGLAIPVRLVSFQSIWALTLTQSTDNWNSGMQATAGFNVFVFDNNQPGFLTVRAQATNGPRECTSQLSHGCYLSWDPSIPTGTIFMTSEFMNDGGHKKSDLMHELGHTLLNANEHYPAYDCTSIMGHSAIESSGSVGYCGSGVLPDILTTVQQHDIDDYASVYGIREAPDATYVQLFGSGTAVHYFEGGYLGGNGHTMHQEQYNWIDRSTTGVTGSYGNYTAGPRRTAYADDATPESDSFADVPGSGSEWCFKRRGRAGGVASNQPAYWGPYSHAYCLAQSSNGSGVYMASNRNNYAAFRVWNYSGATINNVALLLNDGVTHIATSQIWRTTHHKSVSGTQGRRPASCGSGTTGPPTAPLATT